MESWINNAVNQDQVIVIGTSAGGFRALRQLVEQLPKDFPVPILVVMHISADVSGKGMLDVLNMYGQLNCIHAVHGEKATAGNVYLAPSGHHLMIEKGGILMVSKGAQENRSRNAIDPLFRSAAVAYGNRAIGIILTGYLDDGTAGLTAPKRCGGICVVQDPADAEYPDMPTNALNQVKADYCVNLAEMRGLLSKLVYRKIGKRKPVPEDIIREG